MPVKINQNLFSGLSTFGKKTAEIINEHDVKIKAVGMKFLKSTI